MSVALMIKSNLNGNVIDIEGNSTVEGAKLDAFPAKVGTPSLVAPTQFAANQSWIVLRDPKGSEHYIIQNPATGYCIDISENSLKPGAALDVWQTKAKTDDNNVNQLWDFLPDPFGSGAYFIQSPQTGYVIEIKDGSSAAGAKLVVNPRRLFGNNHQLWSAVNEQFSVVTLPSLLMAHSPTSPAINFGSNKQYSLLPENQNTNIKSVTVTIDIIEDLIADTFSIQINGNAPAPIARVTDTQWFAQWSQFILLMKDNSLRLLNQTWHARGPDTPGDPLPSKPEASAVMLTLQNNTVPAGTRIDLKLIIDGSNQNIVTAVSGKISQNGQPVGTPITWSLIGQPAFHPGGPVKEVDLCPFGALSVVVVSAPGRKTNFSSCMGTITVTCDPELTIGSRVNGPNPFGIETFEESNCYYGLVQAGSFKQIVQPFGVLTPKITGVSGVTTVSGTGLYPNSKFTVKAEYSSDGYATIEGTVSEFLTSSVDGSFSFLVTAQDLAANYRSGILNVNVTDSQGNTAWCNISTGGDPRIIGGGGAQRTYW